MNKISDQIALGAKAFLVTEYRYLAIFMIIVSVLFFLLYFFEPPSGQSSDGLRYSLCFLAGGFLSASAGWRGMATATVRFLCVFLLRPAVFILYTHLF